MEERMGENGKKNSDGRGGCDSSRDWETTQATCKSILTPTKGTTRVFLTCQDWNASAILRENTCTNPAHCTCGLQEAYL